MGAMQVDYRFGKHKELKKSCEMHRKAGTWETGQTEDLPAGARAPSARAEIVPGNDNKTSVGTGTAGEHD
jgi:hypothetical protein